MSKEQVSYWVEIADYDLETAKAMYATKRWLYVGFMCHQVVEKIMKAYWCATKPEEARYPSYKQQLSMGLTPEYCKNLLTQTESFVLWIKQQF